MNATNSYRTRLSLNNLDPQYHTADKYIRLETEQSSKLFSFLCFFLELNVYISVKAIKKR